MASTRRERNPGSRVKCSLAQAHWQNTADRQVAKGDSEVGVHLDLGVVNYTN